MRFKLFQALTIVLTIASGLPAFANDPKPDATIRATEQGQLSGRRFEGGEVYFNVPYAAPPVDHLRWRPPVVPVNWQGVRDATQRGPACMQVDQGWNAIDAARRNEDCLYLNIWTPDAPGRHPVMVWFHGGAFTGGAGNTPLYDGEILSRHGVTIVSVNYRLGIFGFLAHPGLSAETEGRRSGNYGLMDQIRALQWIQRNIGSFGGDPNNVTIFGQSAGAASVAYILASPAAKGLFQRAILQSGSPFGIGDPADLASAERIGADFGSVAELRKASAEALLQQWARFSERQPDRASMGPVIDGDSVPARPARFFESGGVNHVNILVGSNSREIPSALDDLAMRARAKAAFGSSTDRALAKYAKLSGTAMTGTIADQLGTDIMFRCGGIETAHVAGRAWLYEFAQPSPGQNMVQHSSDLIYVFGNTGQDGGVLSTRPFTSAERTLSSTIETYWTNFARNGNPNGRGLPIWPSYSPNIGKHLILDERGPRMAHSDAADRCAPLGRKWRALPRQ
jgi:para-nitrobenzyl esterase